MVWIVERLAELAKHSNSSPVVRFGRQTLGFARPSRSIGLELRQVISNLTLFQRRAPVSCAKMAENKWICIRCRMIVTTVSNSSPGKKMGGPCPKDDKRAEHYWNPVR